MGNAPGKPQSRPRNKKYLYLKGAERPSPPGKPFVANEISSPGVLTIRWDPPVKDGGTTLTAYLVDYRRTGSPEWVSNWVKMTPVLKETPGFTIRGLEPGWKYQFRVFAENLVGLSDASDLSEPITLTLQRSTIVAPKFTKELQDAVVLENEKVEFVVYFVGQPPPKLCWFKDGFEIFSSRRTRVLTEHDRSILTIHQSALCDQGEIKCTATNKAGHASTKARLTLEAPPSIRLPRQYEEGLLFEIGEVIRLKVSVAGLPAPLVFWSHDGESVNERERYEIENDGASSTLRIVEALRSDRGEYQIKATNKLGTDVASFMVTVTDKPAPPGKAKVMMTLGRSVTLSWNTPVDDGGSKIGNYIVEYFRLGWNVWLKAATTKQLSTILGDLIEGSEYKFRVKAESPFGVSEPSEESELVFIPDPKRGILQPSARSRSHDILDDVTPVASSRKKARSQSSNRYGNNDYDDVENVPKKPERLKTMSPPRTPEMSPRNGRKDSSLNRSLFDRESIYRDFAYGSPDIKIRHPEFPQSPPREVLTASKEVPTAAKETPSSSGSLPREVSTRPKEVQAAIRENPFAIDESISAKKDQNFSKNKIPVVVQEKTAAPKEAVSERNVDPLMIPNLKSRSPSPNRYVQRTDKPNRFIKEKSPPTNQKPSLSRDNSENLGGSSEFMMVLFPEEPRDMEAASDMGFDEKTLASIPPPLSLSAPELGSEPPRFEDSLRYSVSSTELLHERAMFRFYEEALAEEEAIRRKLEESDRRASLIPKIQINNKDDEDIVGLERKHSLRRRMSAGGSVPQNILLAQKRHSLRNSGDFSDLFDIKFSKTLSVEERREIMKTRQKSKSEEREEEEFEKIRAKMTKEPANKKKISVVREESWDIEDEDFEPLSSMEIDEESSEDERIVHVKRREFSPEDEDQTYHPRMGTVLSKNNQIETSSNLDSSSKPDVPLSKYEAASELLNKPAKLPDANFVPKPILKKSNEEQVPVYKNEIEVLRARSNSLIDEYLNIRQPRQEIEVPMGESHNTSAIASAGLAAAGIVISQPILKQKAADDAKVVIDHYGDIVKTHAHKSVRQNENNPIREALRRAAALQAAMHHSDEEDHEIVLETSNESKESSNQKSREFEARRLEAGKEPKTPEKISSNKQMIEDRLRNIENRIEQINLRNSSPRGAVSKTKDDVYPKSSQTMGKSPEKLFKTEESYAKREPETVERTNIRGREQTRYTRTVAQSKSPSRKASKTPTRKTSTQEDRTDRSSRSSSKTRAPSAKKPPSRSSSVVRNQQTSSTQSNSSNQRNSSTQVQTQSRSNSLVRPPSRSTSKSRNEMAPIQSQASTSGFLRKPKMCEIMTQTSTNVDPFIEALRSGRFEHIVEENLKQEARIKVRTSMDYVTDLAMFAVVIWVFLFSNELLAIPFLLVAVYRQLHEEVKRWIPKWIMRRWNRGRKN